MKKILTTIALALAIPAFINAQGTVTFASGGATQVVKIGGAAPAAGTVTAALYYGTTSNEASLTQLGATTASLTGGFLSGGTRTTGADVAGGSPAFFQIHAWTGGFATYELAYQAALANTTVLIGSTTVFSNPTGNPAGSPPTSPAGLTGWVSGPIALVSVPEPSTIALGMLGAGSLLFIRRKK